MSALGHKQTCKAANENGAPVELIDRRPAEEVAGPALRRSRRNLSAVDCECSEIVPHNRLISGQHQAAFGRQTVSGRCSKPTSDKSPSTFGWLNSPSASPDVDFLGVLRCEPCHDGPEAAASGRLALTNARKTQSSKSRAYRKFAAGAPPSRASGGPGGAAPRSVVRSLSSASGPGR